MGNHNYKHQIEPEQISSTHPLFHQAIILAQQDQKYIRCNIRVQEKEFKEWKSRVIAHKEGTLSHEFLFLPSKASYESDSGFCTNTGSGVNEYPFFQTLLSEETKKRTADKEYFKESQLWYLLYVLTSAKVEMNKHGQKLGDIKPANVFIFPDQKIKVGSILMSPNEKSSYYRLVNKQHDSLDYLLAPEDLEQAKKDAVDNKGNYKAEIFSIGATVLSAGLLSTLQEIYDYKTPTFLQQKYKDILLSWINHSKYSDIFKAIVLNLVSKAPLKRIELEPLWKFISHYSRNIENKEPFIIVNPPDCFEKAVQAVRSKTL